MSRCRRRIVQRCNEGKTWNVTDEVDGILLIATKSNRYGAGFIKMRKCDYENTGAYPSRIPGYSLDKVF